MAGNRVNRGDTSGKMCKNLRTDMDILVFQLVSFKIGLSFIYKIGCGQLPSPFSADRRDEDAPEALTVISLKSKGCRHIPPVIGSAT